MEAILLGIDGTGPLADSKYRSTMKTSFVSYILRKSPAKCKLFMRGPAWDGLDMRWKIGEGYAFVHLHRLTHPKAPVYLAGYSRGGARRSLGCDDACARQCQDCGARAV